MIPALLLLVALEDETPWLPPVSDLKPFPEVEDAAEQVELYRQHLAWVEWMAKQPVVNARCGRDFWNEAKQQTQERLQVWELLMQARGRLEDFRGWGIPPRVFLADLRDRLSDADYRAGRMPPRLNPKWLLKAPEPPAKRAVNQ